MELLTGLFTYIRPSALMKLTICGSSESSVSSPLCVNTLWTSGIFSINLEHTNKTISANKTIRTNKTISIIQMYLVSSCICSLFTGTCHAHRNHARMRAAPGLVRSRLRRSIADWLGNKWQRYRHDILKIEMISSHEICAFGACRLLDRPIGFPGQWTKNDVLT